MFNTAPKVSVISTTFEQNDTLGAHLHSLEAQDYPGAWELLLCDDGSTGDVLSTVRQVRTIDLRYIWQPDRGFRVSRSRNNGLRCATGEVVIFTDASIIVPSDFISKHVALHSGTPRILLGSRLQPVIDRSIWGARNFEFDDLEGYFSSFSQASESEYQELTARSAHPWAAALACNLSICPRQNIFFDEEFIGWGFEDWEFVYRLYAEAAFEVRFSKQLQVFHVEFDPSDFTQRPVQHDKIVLFLRNLLHFLERHPAADNTPLLKSLSQYELNPITNEWNVCTLGSCVRNPLETLDTARRWLEINGPCLVGA